MIARLECWLDSVEPASGPTMSLQESSPKPAKSRLDRLAAGSQSPESATGLAVASGGFSQSESCLEPEAAGSGATDAETGKHGRFSLPEFPLLPVSKGFVITCKKSLKKFKDVLVSHK